MTFLLILIVILYVSINISKQIVEFVIILISIKLIDLAMIKIHQKKVIKQIWNYLKRKFIFICKIICDILWIIKNSLSIMLKESSI
jgi:hypothetical protein